MRFADDVRLRIDRTGEQGEQREDDRSLVLAEAIADNEAQRLERKQRDAIDRRKRREAGNTQARQEKRRVVLEDEGTVSSDVEIPVVRVPVSDMVLAQHFEQEPRRVAEQMARHEHRINDVKQVGRAGGRQQDGRPHAQAAQRGRRPRLPRQGLRALKIISQ